MIESIKNIPDRNTINIAIVGKYIQLEDSYLSVAESLKHAGYGNNVKVCIHYIDSEKITRRKC